MPSTICIMILLIVVAIRVGNRSGRVLKSHVRTRLDINRVHLKFYPIPDYFIKVVPDPDPIPTR